MVELVYAGNPEMNAQLCAWAAARIEQANEKSFENDVAIGVANEGRIIAVAVYSNWMAAYQTMEISMAAESPRWAKKELINELLAYPFEQVGIYKLYTVTPIGNRKALKVNKHIGFTQEAVLAHHFGPGKHGVICRMLLPDYLKRRRELVN